MEIVQRMAVLLCVLTVLCSCSNSLQMPPATGSPLKAAPGSVSIMTERKQIIRKARESYYNLKAAGVTELRFKVLLDFAPALRDLGVDAVRREETLRILKEVSFRVVIGANGVPVVSHQPEIVAGGFGPAMRDAEDLITLALRTWARMSIRLIQFPKINSDYRVEDLGEKYRLTFNAGCGNSEATVVMNHDFSIEEIGCAAPSAPSTVRVKFTRGRCGFELANASMRVKDGSGYGNSALSFHYGEVKGIRVPVEANVTLTSATGRTLHYPLTFVTLSVSRITHPVTPTAHLPGKGCSIQQSPHLRYFVDWHTEIQCFLIW